MEVMVTIEVNPEYEDPDHEMGISEPGYYALVDAIAVVGSISKGPERVGS